MAYPPFEEYQDALASPPREIFSDPVLASGQVLRQRSGEPLALSGNFALTYQVLAAGRHYAVRCFHKHCEALPQRYDAITRRLSETPSTYFVDCDFQPGGIRTESGWYPIVRMDWVDGETLGAFVADNHADSVTMQQLRASLRVLARQLAGLGIAHGDIQPGNIIVRGATDVRLIDYDGMFVPELATIGGAELGQRNFQHPGRRWRHYHAQLDGFAFAVLDVALGALAYRPDLWDIARCDESAFVFRAEDFIEPWSSPAFDWVREIPGLEVKTQYLAAICAAPFDETPGIEDFLAGRNIPAARVHVPSQPFRSRPRYVPAFAVVDAANVAQCCAHIGDRVELIGRVKRARTAGLSLADGGWIRAEFGLFPDDMAALQIHTTATQIEPTLDRLQHDEWVSAIGLVQPPHVERIEDHACKLVTILIDHHSQITRLTPAEAKHRLAASARSRPDDPASERIGTDPAFPDVAAHTAVLTEHSVANESGAASAEATGVAAPAAAPPPAVSDREFLAGVSRRQKPPSWGWIAGSLAALLLILLWVRGGEAPDEAQTTDTTSANPVANSRPPVREPGDTGAGETPDTAATTPTSTGQPALAQGPVLLHARVLRPRDVPLRTALGTVSIVRRSGVSIPAVNRHTVDDVGATSVAFNHLADFGQRIVVTGFASCASSSPQCRGSAPFWLVLRAGKEPRIVRSSGTAVPGAPREIVALPSGIHVDLGVWDGMRRSALLTSGDTPWLVATREPRRRLDRNECLQAQRALESCAAVRGCGSFDAIARAIPAQRAAAIRQLFHQTTGLDAAGFRSLCVRSCQLGLTPTRSFVQQSVCGGAEPGQWDAPLL
jgi:hypothetical protein